MKNLATLWLMALSLSCIAQVDTAQYKVKGRVNAEAAMEKPYVILISIDGFRFDYAQKFGAKNLMRLAQVTSDGLIPSFPTNTFPNHYTLVTGMYPSTHGLIDNQFYDPARDETYAMGRPAVVADSSWYGGLPIWGLAEQNGVLSASLFWVGSESAVAGYRPTYSYRYHNLFTNDRKVEIVTSWLTLPPEVRPHLITLYFPEVDSQGHYHGPDAKETESAVLEVDRAIGKLVEEVERLGLESVNYVIVSDHGMLESDVDRPLTIPAMLNDRRFVLINSFSMLRVHVLNPEQILPTYRKLKREKNRQYKVYLANRFPKRLHFRGNPRIGDILLVPKAPKVFASQPPSSRRYPGAHGYDPKKVKAMNGVFMAWGPAFGERQHLRAFQNIHLYPLLAQLMGLEVNHRIDGKAKVLDKVLLK